jgi:hypothetical protein
MSIIDDISDSVSDFAGGVGDTAQKVTGNVLGIPGFDFNMLRDPTNIAGYAPLTKIAGLVGAGWLAAPALAESVTSFAGGGAADAGMADALGLGSPADIAAVEQSISSGASQATTGLSTDASSMLNAGTGATTAEATGGAAAAGPAAVPPPAPAPLPEVGGPSSLPGGASNGGIVNWAQKNPLLAYGALQVGSGAIQGIGANLTANEMADKKAAADRALLTQKYNEEKALADWRQRFQQGASYFTATPNMAPNPGAVLRRPDGTPVYAGNGLVSGAMKG